MARASTANGNVPGNLPAATRGRIVQRVLVDGWTPAQAAAAFGVGERSVVRWVAAYRRRGMASLRDAEADGGLSGCLRRLRLAALRLVAPPPPEQATAELAPFLPSRYRHRR
ncbi:MAG: helix-turn-helix domain-containing protein [Thiohalocapsa sp.]